jgi:hypothetical protein
MTKKKDDIAPNQELPPESIVGTKVQGDEGIDLEDKKLLNHIMAEFKRADDWFESNMRSDFQYCQDASISYLRDKDNWTVSNAIFDPESEKIANALIAKYVVGLFAKGGTIDFDIDWAGPADMRSSKAIKKMMKSMMKKMPNFADSMLTFIRQLVLYGTAVMKIVYDIDTRKIKVVKRDKEGNPVKSKGKLVYDIKDAILYEGIKFVPIDVVQEFRIDPNATSIDGFAKFHRTWMTMAQVREQGRLGHFQNVNKIKPTQAQLKSTLQRSYDGINPQATDASTIELPDNAEIEIIEYWSPDDSMRIVVGNRNTILTPKADRYNPFFHGKHPFVSSIFEKIDFQFYGRGAMMKAKPQQTLINLLTNLDIEEALRHICRMYKVIDGEVPKGETLVFVPDGKISVVSPDSLTPLDNPPYDLASANKIATLKADAEEITGATRMSSAMGGQPDRQTATEAVLLQRMGSELHAMHIWAIDQLGLIKAIDLAYRLILQCAGREIFLKYGEKSMIGIDPAMLPYEVRFTPKIGIEVMSKESITQYLMTFLQTVGPLLLQSGYPMSIAELSKFFIENMGIHAEEIGLDAPQVTPQVGGEPVEKGVPMGNEGRVTLLAGTPSEPLVNVPGGIMGGQNA